MCYYWSFTNRSIYRTAKQIKRTVKRGLFMRYIPIHVDTKDARILIIGGEEAAEAKLRTLIKTEADLILVAPELSPEITRWAEKGILTHVARDFEPSDLDNVRLVYEQKAPVQAWPAPLRPIWKHVYHQALENLH